MFSDCTIKNVIFNPEDRYVPGEASFKLCCKAERDCTLCLVIETEVSIPTDKEVENESYSGTDEEDSNEDTRNDKCKNSSMFCFFLKSTDILFFNLESQ